MTELRVCQLCFKATKDFQAIEENLREILDVLLLKIDFSLNEEYVICENCADNINTFFKFKSVYLYTQDTMAPFIKSVNGMEADMVQITNLKENSSADTKNYSDDAICRLCLKRDRCVDLNGMNECFGEDITAKCLPELDIKFSRDPKICLSCQTTLVNYYQFVTKCLVKQENTEECDDRDACLAIKSEVFDIKTEEEECYGNTNNSLSLTHSSTISSEDTEIKSFVDKSYNQETYQTSINSDPNQDASEIEMEYPNAVPFYRCSHCPYLTKRKGDLSRHVLSHLEIRTYQCNFCSYKAKWKGALTAHMLTHKDASEITTYDCSFCSYKAKQKGTLTTHMLIHKDASEITTYDCSFCSYKAKRKGNLNKHMLTHQDASEVTTYDCSVCSYKAKQKSNLSRHMLIHNDVSEVATYDCSFCSYKAKRKGALTTHMVIHKDASEITTYQCNFCSYKAKLKGTLTAHMLIHKDASEITTYDCDLCSYKAKRKGALNAHMLTHKDASEITTYDCSVCSYKAKQKHNLTAHMLIHKNVSERTIYRCAHCSFNTKWKSYLTKHMRFHKDAC